MAKVDIGQRFYEARTKLNQHNKNGESVRAVCEAIGIKPSSLYLYESNDGKTGRIPNMKNAQLLADYYGVNVLWLLGESDSPSLDESSQMITKSIGLSDKAICAVKEMKDNRLIETLNLLLESEEFPKMVRWFKTARLINQNCTDEDRTSQIGDDVYQGIIEDTDGKEFENTWFPGGMQVDMCLWKASKELDKAYSKIMEEEKSNGKR